MTSSKTLMRTSGLDDALVDLQYLEIQPGEVALSPLPEHARGGSCSLQIGTYSGRKTTFPLQVGVKVLRMGYEEEDRVRTAKEFMTELRVWASLRHQNLLPLLGFYVTRDLNAAWLISEWQYNGNIWEYTRQHGPELRYKLLVDALLGLEYLHSATPPVIHRDIKPGNVLVGGDPPRAMLCDFGLCKPEDPASPPQPHVMSSPELHSESELAHGTWGHILTSQTGDLKGTLRYMAPELLRETPPPYSAASDMWVWACMAHEVVAGEAPYAFCTNETRITSAIHKGRAPSTTVYTSGSWSLVQQLYHCWEQRPTDRPTAASCRDTFTKGLSYEEMENQESEIIPSKLIKTTGWLQDKQQTMYIKDVVTHGSEEWTVQADRFFKPDTPPPVVLRIGSGPYRTSQDEISYKDLPTFLQTYLNHHAHRLKSIGWIAWSLLRPAKGHFFVNRGSSHQWSTSPRLAFLLCSLPNHFNIVWFGFQEDAAKLVVQFTGGGSYRQLHFPNHPSLKDQSKADDSIGAESPLLRSYAEYECGVGLYRQGSAPEDEARLRCQKEERFAFYITRIILMAPGVVRRLQNLSSDTLANPIEIDQPVQRLIESPEDSPEWNNAELRAQLRNLIQSLLAAFQLLTETYYPQVEEKRRQEHSRWMR